jgi:hypothetical protein
LLRGGKNRDLENVVAHSQPNYVRPTGNLPTDVRFANDTSSGPSFFERLFGAPTPPPAPPGRRPPRPVIDRSAGWPGSNW